MGVARLVVRLFHLDRPISAASIQKASLLAEAPALVASCSVAQEAGLRVPKVVAVGSVEAWGAMARIPFVVYELIETRTVEDEVLAPREQLLRVIGGIKAKLCGRSLSAVDTEPLPRFEEPCGIGGGARCELRMPAASRATWRAWPSGCRWSFHTVSKCTRGRGPGGGLSEDGGAGEKRRRA